MGLAHSYSASARVTPMSLSRWSSSSARARRCRPRSTDNQTAAAALLRCASIVWCANRSPMIPVLSADVDCIPRPPVPDGPTAHPLEGLSLGGRSACPQSIVSLACPSFSHDVGHPMLRRLPSLNAVRAFEAAARHESFTQAAQELCVTQGAVSHQVKALEVELGIKLFNRERQRLVITDAGRQYLSVVRDALDRIAIGTERLQQRQSSGVLTVSTSPDFAAKWLVHRLGRFAEAYPDIDLRVSATLHHVDFAREDVDLAVRHGDGHWAGLDVVRL